MSLINEPQPELWVLTGDAVAKNVIYLLLGLVGLTFNTYLLSTFIKHRKELLVSHLSVVSVTLADWGFGLCSVIMYFAHAVSPSLSMSWCQATGALNAIFPGASVLSFSFMAVERYLMIVHSKRFTYQQVTLILISLWISGSAFAALTFIGQIYFVVQSSGVYCLGDLRGTTVFHRLYSIGCVAVIFGTEVFTATSYYMIYRTALKDGFKWSDQLKSVDLKSGNSSVPRGSIVAGMNPNRASVASTPSATLTTSRKAYEKQLRLTKKLATITFIFFACWFGTLCSFTYQIATSEFVPPMVDFLLTMCPNLNSILNPLIVMTLDERWKVNWRFPWSLKKPAEGEA